jgi:hypothetical protein
MPGGKNEPGLLKICWRFVEDNKPNAIVQTRGISMVHERLTSASGLSAVSLYTPGQGPATEANLKCSRSLQSDGIRGAQPIPHPPLHPEGHSRVSHIHIRQSSHCTALSIRNLTRFSGYRCGQEAEHLPPPPARLSVDQLVQLATDAGLSHREGPARADALDQRLSVPFQAVLHGARSPRLGRQRLSN